MLQAGIGFDFVSLFDDFFFKFRLHITFSTEQMHLFWKIDEISTFENVMSGCFEN